MALTKMLGTPALFAVYVDISPYPNCGFTESFTSRIGPAKTLEEAKGLIAMDRKAMGDTFGGMLPSVSLKGRSYRIFKSKGWEEIVV